MHDAHLRASEKDQANEQGASTGYVMINGADQGEHGASFFPGTYWVPGLRLLLGWETL